MATVEIIYPSVMKKGESISFENKTDQEYEQAVKDGFKGTKEEYLTLKDYT